MKGKKDARHVIDYFGVIINLLLVVSALLLGMLIIKRLVLGDDVEPTATESKSDARAPLSTIHPQEAH